MDTDDSFDAIYGRLLHVTGVKTDSGLARFLDIKPQSVVAARKRRQIPPGWIVLVAKANRIATDWLFFGLGPISLDDKRAEADLTGKRSLKETGTEELEGLLAEKDRRIFDLEHQLAQAKEETLKAYRLLVDTQEETLKAYRLAVGAMQSPVDAVQVPPPPQYRQATHSSDNAGTHKNDK